MWHIKPGTWRSPAEHQRNTGTLTEHCTGMLAEQSEYYGIMEHEKSSRIMEILPIQNDNILSR